MAECSEIEAGGEVRKIKDTTARSGVAANAAAIEAIEAVIPSTASASNKLLTKDDLPTVGTIMESASITTNNTTWATHTYTFPSSFGVGKWQLYVKVASTAEEDVLFAIQEGSFGGNVGLAPQPGYGAQTIPLPYLLNTTGGNQVQLKTAQKSVSAVNSSLIAIKIA